MSDEYRRIGLITGSPCRRRWTTDEKLQILEEAMRSGASVSAVARRHGVAPSLVYRWRRLMQEGSAIAVGSDAAVVGEVKRRGGWFHDVRRIPMRLQGFFKSNRIRVSLDRKDPLTARAKRDALAKADEDYWTCLMHAAAMEIAGQPNLIRRAIAIENPSTSDGRLNPPDIDAMLGGVDRIVRAVDHHLEAVRDQRFGGFQRLGHVRIERLLVGERFELH